MRDANSTDTDTIATTCATTQTDIPRHRFPPGRPLHGQGKHAHQQVYRVMARLKGDDGARSAYLDHKIKQWCASKFVRARLISRCAAQAERSARQKKNPLRDNADLAIALDFKGQPNALLMFPRGF